MSSTTSDAVREFIQGLDWSRRGRRLNTMIRAGAGAGKTTELVARVLSLALKTKHEEQRFPRLVVTTFTKKATQELKERLLAAALKTEDDELLRYIQQSRSLQVSTIHGSLQRFLMLYGSVLGLSSDFSVMEDREYHWLRGKVLRQMISDEPERAAEAEILLEDWSLQDFWQAFAAWEENELLHPGAEPETAEDVRRAQAKTLADLEKLGQEVLRELGSQKLTPAWQKYETLLSDTLFQIKGKNTYEQVAIWLENFDKPPAVRMSADTDPSFKTLFEDFKKEVNKKNLGEYRLSPEFPDKLERSLPAFRDLAKALSDRLLKVKIAEGKVAKSDLEQLTLKILRMDPEKGEHFGKSWDYWMIDEFQDTSPLQIQILAALAGKEGRGFYVGDPQQSIYLFRGARSEVFFEKENEIERIRGEKLRLMTNYRSAPPLMHFLNAFLPGLNPEQFAPMEIGAKEREWGGPQALFWQVPKPEVAEAEESDESLDDGSEATPEDIAVLARVQELLAAGAPASSICVLSRNNENLRRFAALATEKSLPFYWGGDASFADRTEVRDALSFMKFLAQPHDNLNLLCLLRSPWFFLEDKDIRAFSQNETNSYFKKWGQQAKAGAVSAASIARFKELSGVLTEAQHRGVSPIWLAELLKKHFVDKSYAMDPSGRRESNFWKLIAQLRFEEREAGFSLMGFIESLEDSRRATDSEDEDAPAVEEPSRVQLMTIHASKGLQFDHVILGWAARARFATKAQAVMAEEKTGRWSLGLRSDEDGTLKNSAWGLAQAAAKLQRETEEYDRFLYVALTRAKLSVSMIWSPERMPKQSWPARWPLMFEEGHQSLDNYSIECRSSQPVLTSMTSSQSSGSSVRAPWREISTPKTREYVSFEKPEWLRFAKIQDGVRIHRWMEALQMSWDKNFDPEIESLKQKLSDFAEVDLKALIQEGEVEWSFLVKKEGITSGTTEEWVPGRIDMWGKDAEGRVWLVDYKTGSSHYRDKAILQLQIYTWALYKLGQIPEMAEVRLLPLFLFEEGSRSEKAPTFTELESSIDSLLTKFRGA